MTISEIGLSGPTMAAKDEYCMGFAEAEAAMRDHGYPSTCAPFDRPEWFAALASQCFPDQRPIIVYHKAGDAVCWLFLISCDANGGLAALANYYSFWWRPLFSGGDRQSRLDALTAMARMLRLDVGRISLTGIRAEDREMIEHGFRAAGWVTALERGLARHYLDLAPGTDFASYWADRPGHLRQTVARKQRRDNLVVTIHTLFDANLWADYLAVYDASWKPRETYPDFLRALAENESRRGALRLGIARADGVPIAAQLWSVAGGAAYIHKLAHILGSEGHSPGTLLTHAMMRHAIDVDRVAHVDFGTGDDRFKADWMNGRTVQVSMSLFNPAWPSSWPAILRSTAARTRLAIRDALFKFRKHRHTKG